MTTSYPARACPSTNSSRCAPRPPTCNAEFDGTFGAETIERFLHSSYDEFAGRAVVLNFLPLLAERFARQRLTALARVEGKHNDGVPVALFLCTHNAGRSQMALGFFTHLAGDRAVAWSGGSDPADQINPAADRSDGRTGHRHLRRVPQAVDRRGGPRRRRRHHHGLRRRLPRVPRPPLRRLGPSTTPPGSTSTAVRPIRDDIERRVRDLLDDMHVPAHA